MSSDVIRIYKTLHTWTGLIAGMALFICFFAGALTMFKGELGRWAAPPAKAPLAWVGEAQWPALIGATVAAHPAAARGFVLHLQPSEDVPAPLVWRDPPGRGPAPGAVFFGATLDQQGNPRSVPFQPTALGELIDQLHQTAGIPGRGHHLWGVYIMGAVSVLYALALVSGLIVLLPTLVKDLFALRAGKNRKRFWLDAHNVVGITSLPFHLMIALTVIVFAFHDQIYDGLQVAVYGDRPIFGDRPAQDHSATRDPGELLSPAQLSKRLAALAPSFQPREITYSDVLTDHARVRVAGVDPGHMLRGADRGFAAMDPYSGAILDTAYLPGHEGPWTDIVITFFALHFGNFGGAFMRWVYFLLGLSGAFLFYTGNLLWIETRRRKQRRGGDTPVQRRVTRAMASATVGVCWGSVAGVCAAMVAGKWLHGVVESQSALYMSAYYSVFLASVAWAFVAGPARSLVHLLAASAAFALAIPATSLLAAVLPSSPAWLHTAPDLLAVEVTALVGGLLLLVMTRRTARRVRHGSRDSVWASGTP